MTNFNDFSTCTEDLMRVIKEAIIDTNVKALKRDITVISRNLIIHTHLYTKSYGRATTMLGILEAYKQRAVNTPRHNFTRGE
jgi:hypothetical protein